MPKPKDKARFMKFVNKTGQIMGHLKNRVGSGQVQSIGMADPDSCWIMKTTLRDVLPSF